MKAEKGKIKQRKKEMQAMKEKELLRKEKVKMSSKPEQK